MPNDDEAVARMVRGHARKLFPKPLQITCLKRSNIVAPAGLGNQQDVPMHKTVVLCENVGQYVAFVEAVMRGELIPFPPFELQAFTALLDMLGALKEPEDATNGDA